MANYKLTESAWLAKEIVRIQSVLTHHMRHGQSYSGADLKRMIVYVGLNYTDAEFVQLRDELISLGVIETA